MPDSAPEMPPDVHSAPGDVPPDGPGKEATPLSQDQAGRPAGSGKWWLFIGLVVVAAVGAAYLSQRKPLLPIPVPANLNGLDPLLRQYVTSQVAWVREAPRDASRHAVLGLVYAANGLWSEANLAFENVTRLNPGEPLAYLYWAVSFQELGQPERATNLLAALTTRFPGFAPGYFRLGDYALRLGAIPEAERAFQRLIELAPQEWRGFAGLGETKLRAGNASEAAAFLEQAVRIDPAAKSVHALLGQAYQHLGRTREAERELSLGMNAAQYAMPDAWSVQAPQHMRLLVDLIDMAQEHCQNGTPSNAVRVLEMARPFHPDNPTVLVTLALAHTQSGHPEQARPLLEHALQLNPSSVPAYAALSGCDLALGRPEQALSNANQAVLLATNRVDGYLAKANVLLAMEQDADAISALREAHHQDPKNPQILLDLGDIWLRNLKQPEAALPFFQEAAALAPFLLPAQLRLASAQIQLGNKQAALTTLQAARELAPNDPGITAALARLAPKPTP